MDHQIKLTQVYVPSPDIVARQIEDELIIVPIVSGIGNMEDELFSLNDTGRAVWDKLSKDKPLDAVIQELTKEYDCSIEEMTEDVSGLIKELLSRNIVVLYDPTE